MLALHKTRDLLASCSAAIADFARNRQGIAALEFALIAPLLLSMYFVTLEVSQAIATDKKVSRIASMTADLITQQPTITKADLDAIMAIGENIIQPYYRSKPTIDITAITLSDEASPKATVAWSRKLTNSVASVGATKGTTATIPDALKVRNGFLVRVVSSLAYKPVITYAAANKPALGLTAAFDGIAMQETYYLRPRMSQTVTCSDC